MQATRYDLGHGAWLDLWPRLVSDHFGSALDDSESGSSWLHYLRGELPLAPESYRIVGRLVTSPRLVSWHGDADTGYVYSGVRHEPKRWTPGLAQLRMRIEKVTGLTFNSVLANLYRTGSDGMGWHADAEPEIGPSPTDRWVASLSFGEPRRFILRHRSGTNKHELLLGHGDLLVMRGTTQREYRHGVPKTKQPVGPRLNLTFRHVICAAR